MDHAKRDSLASIVLAAAAEGRRLDAEWLRGELRGDDEARELLALYAHCNTRVRELLADATTTTEDTMTPTNPTRYAGSLHDHPADAAAAAVYDHLTSCGRDCPQAAAEAFAEVITALDGGATIAEALGHVPAPWSWDDDHLLDGFGMAHECHRQELREATAEEE